jgi:hypothetical protein
MDITSITLILWISNRKYRKNRNMEVTMAERKEFERRGLE